MDSVLGITQAKIIAATHPVPPVRPVVVNGKGDVVLKPDSYQPAQGDKPDVTYGPAGSGGAASS